MRRDGSAVVWLDELAAASPERVGAKAANLARAAAAGLPVLRGFVLTTDATRGGRVDADAVAAVRSAWERLTQEAGGRLIVRSSSTIEDTSTSSMAGQFTTALGVEGWPAFVDAIASVLSSASAPTSGAQTARPMAVLVQPELAPECGGVLFGLDPVTGARHAVVEVVPGTPEALVSGTASASHAVLGRAGRLRGGGSRRLRTLLSRSRRWRLARLARRAALVFGRPQDIEWAIDRSDRLWLLQSRDVTAWGDGTFADGPVLGPGPVAETFPDPLRPLEVDLWIAPLRDGVAHALRVTGAVAERRIDRSPVVCTVGGRVAADLELFALVPAASRVRSILNPMRGIRRVVAAWRVGRLRVALPGIVDDLLAAVDAELVALPPLEELDDVELVALLRRCRDELVSLHGHEVLAGMLLSGTGAAGASEISLPAAALDALEQAAADGLDDAAATARSPVVLALVPPAIAMRRTLPRPPVATRRESGRGPGVGGLGTRDALRLRCRWVQELSARCAEELGRHLAGRGALARASLVVELRLDELDRAMLGHVPTELTARAALVAGPPLPTAFRLSESATPVPVGLHQRGGHDGLPAGGGRGSGIVRHSIATFRDGERPVLVVDTLEPRLAPALGSLAGLVAETGSALSHVAILAREEGVPTVVAVEDARRRFPEGAEVLVDGTTGEVQLLEEASPC